MQKIRLAPRFVFTCWLLISAACRPASAQMVTSDSAGCPDSAGLCQHEAGVVNLEQEPGVTISAAGAGPVTQVSTLSFRDATAVVTGKPYKGEAVTAMTQNLMDGSTIQQSIHATIARDKEGRTVRIQEIGKFGALTAAPASANNSGQSTVTLTSIFDPVANRHIDYTSDNKVAHELVAQAPETGTNISTQGGFGLATSLPMMGKTISAMPVAIGQAPLPQNDPNAEQLGSRTISGVSTVGTRTKTVIPAGAIGNNRDLTIVNETWYSPDLHMVMESTQTDPRFGQTTYSITNFEQVDPDESLFQPPPGYTIQTVPVHTTAQ
jgi:hypothetical protein